MPASSAVSRTPCRILNRRAALVPAALLLAAIPAATEAACDPDGTQASGAVYRICMPERWNGDLVVFAHGYVAFNEPIAIPEDQLVLPDGTRLPELVNALGFAFATTSYSTNGLAILNGLEDVTDLVGVFAWTRGRPRRTFIVGPSEGGLIAALAVERRPDLFSGGLSACGPIGDFARQINWLGDYRVIFDTFFPNTIPGSPIAVPHDVIEGFETTVSQGILEAIRSYPDRTRQVLAVTGAPTDPADPATVEETILDLSWYSVFTPNDASEKLGGQPFENRRRIYTGSDNDFLLNLRVDRFAADPIAVETMRSSYRTTGRLTSPLVTLHTRGDPIIPYWHQRLYRLKTLLTGSGPRHVNIPIDRYGHCNFRASETLAAFAVLLLLATGETPAGAEAALAGPDEAAAYRALLETHAPAAVVEPIAPRP